MNVLKNVFAFYINASMHVALAVILFVWITVQTLELNVALDFYMFIFLATITGYNFVKYAKIAGLHHRSLAKSLKAIQIFSLICAVLLLYFTTKQSPSTLISLLLFSILTFFYAVPVFNKINLRAAAGVKIFIVAIVWAGVTVITPVVAGNHDLNTAVWLTFFQRVCMVLVLILPFEIRDVLYDISSLKTFPQQFGIKKTKGIGIAFLVGIVILEGMRVEVNVVNLCALTVTLFVLGILLVRSKKEQSRYFASFWVEGVPVFYALMLLLFSCFSTQAFT